MLLHIQSVGGHHSAVNISIVDVEFCGKTYVSSMTEAEGVRADGRNVGGDGGFGNELFLSYKKRRVNYHTI